MTRRLVLALDQGTTSSRAILFDDGGRPVATAQREFPQHTPSPGVVEHDPEDIWSSQVDCARDVLAGLGPGDAVVAVGITNQRETVLLWDRDTGRPVAPAIVWQSRVSAPICERLKAEGLEATVRSRTGLLLDPYFSATKIMHLFESRPGLAERCRRGEVLFGTVDTFLIWRLTGGRVHATDRTNASRTLLYDLAEGGWSDELCGLFGVPRRMLPEIRPSSGSFGETDAAVLGFGLPILGCAGDQQAAAYAHGCVEPGDAKNTYGTGAFLLFATGSETVASRHGLLATPACDDGTGRGFMLEGSVFVAGAVVQWLRDGLGIIDRAGDIGPLAASVPDAGGVVLVPALAGLGTPDWDPRARGLMIGLTRGTGRGHIARAALEGIAASVADVVAAMEADAGRSLTHLRVDGGASGCDLLLQLQADLLGVRVDRPAVLETTALGAAMLAGRACGLFDSPDAAASARRIERSFEPSIDAAARRVKLAVWRDAVGRSKAWARD